MKAKTDRHNNLTFEESVDDYRQRLLALEIELAELYEDKQISKSKYKSKLSHIKFLKQTLDEITNEWTAGQRSFNSDLYFPIPVFEECSSSEQKICRNYLESRNKTLKNLVKITNNLIRSIKTTLAGKSSTLILTLKLSQLRTYLTRIDSQTQALMRNQKKIDEFTNSLLKEDKLQMQSNSLLHNIKIYIQFFNQIKTSNTQVKDLKIKAFKEKQKVLWMEKWLKFQKQKLESYFPSKAVPDSVAIKQFSELLLQNSKQPKKSEKHSDFKVKEKESLSEFRKKLRESFKQRAKN